MRHTEFPSSAEVHPQRVSENAARRQTIRKGTRSCWDCKRRKVRCVFASPRDAVCSNCRRRGAVCVSQDLPETLAPARDEQIGDRIARVENLVHDLAEQVNVLTSTLSSHTPSLLGSGDTPMPASTSYPVPEFHDRFRECDDTWTTNNTSPPSANKRAQNPQKQMPSRLGQNGKITQTLLAAFPSRQDTENICKMMHSYNFYFHLADSRSFGSLEREGLTPLKIPPSSAELLDTTSHPVLLARTMLLICSFLLVGVDNNHRLTEEPPVIIDRLIEAVSSQVTNNEKLQGPMEYLECILYESVFHKSKGNLRKAWKLVRRALLVAQMMGIHRARAPLVKTIDSAHKIDPHFVWFRIVYLDRYLCLLLGLPQGTSQTEMPPEAVLARDAPLDKLNRLQAGTASRILERNERSPEARDLTLTHEIDAELVRIGTVMPEEFWMVPEFRGIETGSKDEFWETARISSQIFYYTLVTQLHLPYLLRFDPDVKYDYSKITCVNASREILTRFLTYHRFQNATVCHRALGILALTAATTLLLGHLDNHLHRQSTSFFAHQRRSDRAMMQFMLKSIEETKTASGGIIGDQDLGTLRSLLHIEEDAAKGHDYTIINAFPYNPVTVDEEDREYEEVLEDFKSVTISIPHLGQIRIERQGVRNLVPASIDANGMSVEVASNCRILDELDTGSTTMPSFPDLDTEMYQFLALDSEPFRPETSAATQSQNFGYEPFETQQPSNIEKNTTSEQEKFEGLLSNTDDWTSETMDIVPFDTPSKRAPASRTYNRLVHK